MCCECNVCVCGLQIDEPPTPYHNSAQGSQDEDSVYSSSPATPKPGQNLMDQIEQLQAKLNVEQLRRQEKEQCVEADEAEGDAEEDGDGRGGGVHFDDTSSEKS